MENYQILKKSVVETYRTLGFRQRAREILVEMMPGDRLVGSLEMTQ